MPAAVRCGCRAHAGNSGRTALQPQKLKRQIALRLQHRGELLQVEPREIGIEQFGLDAGLDIGGKIFAVAHRHIGLRRAGRRTMHETQHLGAQLVEQQPRADIGVIRLLLHQRARRHHRRQRQFALADAVVEIALRLGEHGSGADAVETGAGLLDDQRQARDVERDLHAARQRDAQRGFPRRLGGLGSLLSGTLPRALLAIQHVSARDLVVLAAHQGQFDLVLHVLDVKGAALAHPARQRADDFRGQLIDDFMDAAGGGRAMAFDREKRLGHRDRYLAGVEFRNRSVAADHLHRKCGFRRS
jgi:hypothetical protein